MKHKDLDGIRHQASKDDVAGDGGEHPFVKESIQKSIALRKTAALESGLADVVSPSDVVQSAAVESSCDSLGSKTKINAILPEAVVDDVLSFEQRRKEILRMTREAEERKKRFVHLRSFAAAAFILDSQAAGEDARADGARSKRGRRTRAQEERSGACST
jgi:hypothetical protein